MRRTLERLANEYFDLLIIGGGDHGRMRRARRLLARIQGGAGREERFRQCHQRPQFQAHPWRAALSAQFRAWAGAGIAERAAHLAAHRTASGATPAISHSDVWRRTARNARRLACRIDALRHAIFRSRLARRSRTAPAAASWLKREAALAREPVLERPGFRRRFRYYDAQMYSPERLALECLIDADPNMARRSQIIVPSDLRC